ncbi:MAG: hypothetical protein ACUVTG_01325 [Candidatus Oleimicrobiaceae bacterium]
MNQTGTKRLAAHPYWVAVSLLVVAIALRLTLHLLRKSNVTPEPLDLKTRSFPTSYLSPAVRGARATRIVFVYSQFDCQECVVSYLKGLKEATRKATGVAVQVIGCGELEEAKYAQWARVHKLDFSFTSTSEEALLESVPGLEVPAIMVIDKANNVLASWRAEVMNIPTIFARIARYLSAQAS